jgi:uncharacterized protein (DUF58 family)
VSRRSPKKVTPLYAALTVRGRAVLAGSVLVASVGAALRYPELIGLGAAGVVAVAAALLMVARAPSLQVERLVSPARVPRGVAASALVQVRSNARGRSPAVLARDVAGSTTVPFVVPRLRQGTVHEGTTQLPTSRRGVVASGPLLVDRGDPLGLALRTLNSGQSAELYVRPRAVDLPEIGASLARSVDGPQADTMMEGTLAFDALRDYVPGDELRHVHWRASAHAGKLVVKQHVDTAHAALAVVLDVTVPAAGTGQEERAVLPDALAEAFETAVDCAASVAVVAAVQRQPLLLIAGTGESLLPGNAQRHRVYTVDDVLDSLTKVDPVIGDGPPRAGGGLPVPARRAAQAGPVDRLPITLRRLAGRGRGSLAVVISARPMDWLAAPLQSVTGSYARVVAVQAVAGGAQPSSAARTGRILWVSVRQAGELAPAMVRARAAA